MSSDDGRGHPPSIYLSSLLICFIYNDHVKHKYKAQERRTTADGHSEMDNDDLLPFVVLIDLKVNRLLLNECGLPYPSQLFIEPKHTCVIFPVVVIVPIDQTGMQENKRNQSIITNSMKTQWMMMHHLRRQRLDYQMPAASFQTYTDHQSVTKGVEVHKQIISVTISISEKKKNDDRNDFIEKQDD
jgi:hypothetical protein